MAGKGRKQIADDGKATRFEKGVKKHPTSKDLGIPAWSIRGWMRFYTTQNIDWSAFANPAEAAQKLTGPQPLVSQVLAIKALFNAMASKSNPNMLALVMDSVEGKLTDKTEISGPNGGAIEVHESDVDMMRRFVETKGPELLKGK